MLKTGKQGEWLTVYVPRNLVGLSIEQLLREKWQTPKTLLHQFRMNKSVKLNGETTPWSSTLHIEDKLQVHLFTEEEFGFEPEYMDIEVLYEDDHLLIVNKPAKIDTHPNEPGQLGTLANGVAYYFQAKGIFTKVRHIHRLDKDTTGAVLFAKHKLAGAMLDRMLEAREIKRTYLALAQGRIKQAKGKIDAPIGRDRHHPTRRRVSPNGQTAISHYKVLDYYSKNDLSLVELELQTGRTHQIRVHMSHIGHPLFGDVLYGGRDEIDRQALHAAKIRLKHPITDESIEVRAPFLDEPAIFPREI
ncbi:23S rRNA pseudouridine1911/1915/1917 synthase [Bacillus luteolus]|nr:23S rRNA pseudouridine1911/1915/1917 synthase [Cytobacillus luteolus]